MPGHSISCAGPGSCAGYQVCNADGSKYEPCKCDGDAAGGASASGGTSGADASTGATGGVSGAGAMDGGVAGAGSGGFAGGGTVCNPTSTCWNKSKIGAGSLNKAFADKNGKLYVGNGAAYFTNATGTWVSKPLNSDKWAIDENGNPHTVLKAGAATMTYSGIEYSELVGGAWTSEPIPNISPASCEASFGDPTAWDVLVEPNGSPHLAWNRPEYDCFPAPNFRPSYSYKSGAEWVSVAFGDNIEPNAKEPLFIAAALDANGHFHQAHILEDSREVRYFSNDPQSYFGLLSPVGEFSGQIVLAKPPGQPIFALFSGKYYDNALGGWDPRVVLTEGVTFKPNWKATLISCPSETAVAHALDVRPNGIVSLAWVSTTTAQARFATNASGIWAYADLGSGVDVALVVTAPAQLNLFLEQGGDIFHLTPC